MSNATESGPELHTPEYERRITETLAEAGHPLPWRTLEAERPRAGQVVEARPYGMSGILRAKYDPPSGAWVPVNPVLKSVLKTSGDQWRPLPPKAPATVPPPTRLDVLERAERRERTAERILPVVVADYLRVSNEGGAYPEWKADVALEALDIADAFWAEADRRRDEELEGAR